MNPNLISRLAPTPSGYLHLGNAFNFLLTYDDCPEIRELYSDFDIKNEEWMYHTANSNVTTRKVGKELFIKNF